MVSRSRQAVGLLPPLPGPADERQMKSSPSPLDRWRLRHENRDNKQSNVKAKTTGLGRGGTRRGGHYLPVLFGPLMEPPSDWRGP